MFDKIGDDFIEKEKVLSGVLEKSYSILENLKNRREIQRY
jgi:hypothetical protein